MIKLLIVMQALLFLALTKPAYADVAIKEFVEAQCPINETMVTCDNGKNWYGKGSEDLCTNYRLNPSYQRLSVETKHGERINGDHSTEKYCLRAGSFFELIGFHFFNSGRLLLITLILEVPLFYLFKFRTKKVLSTIILMNIISVPALYFLSLALPYRNLYILVALEIGVIISESYLLRRFNREFTFRHIFIFTLIINAISAILGSSINSMF